MHYIVQENIFKENHYNLLIQTLDKFQLSYQLVRVYPFIDKIVELKNIPDILDNIEDLPDFYLEEKFKNNTFIFGSVKLARILSKYDIFPGSQINDNHDFEIYRKYYKDNLVNNNSLICNVSDDINWQINEKKFIRPTKDTKSFTGKVFSKEDWEELVEACLKNKNNIFNKETTIQITDPKEIQKEIRFWCVGGKIITGSQYAIGGKVIYNEYYDEEAENFAQKMVDIYQPAEAFVIDVCLINNEWKIVEINCINCAGFYLCNMQTLITELEYYFTNNNNS